jgi:hypothetical protein
LREVLLFPSGYFGAEHGALIMSDIKANENLESPHAGKVYSNDTMLQLVVEAWFGATSTDGSKATTHSAGQRDAEKDSKSVKDAASLGLPDTTIVDPKNPSPDSWKYDSKGHLLYAGDRVSAKYDAHGDLQKAKIDGETWERKGNDVQLTFKDRDGVTQTDVMHNVTKFDLTTEDLNSDGKFKDAKVDVQYGRAQESGSANVIWQSEEHQDNMRKLGP